MQRRRRTNHGAGAEKVGVLRSGLGQNKRRSCMYVYVCMCVCVSVTLKKKAKLFFSVRSTQFPFKLNILFKKI